MTLRQAIKKYPKGMIYYYDNQSWIFYKKPVTDKTTEEELAKLEVMEGNDWNSPSYAPDIVIELAKILGIKVDSI